MSFTAVRSYFRARATSSGWKEWKDVFDDQNIPQTILDGAYHLPPLSSGSSRTNQIDTEVPVTQVVRFFKKGHRDVAAGLDSAILSAESFVKLCLKASNRLTGAGLKNVQLSSMSYDQLGNNNDLIRVTMTFSCLVILDTE